MIFGAVSKDFKAENIREVITEKREKNENIEADLYDLLAQLDLQPFV